MRFQGLSDVRLGLKAESVYVYLWRPTPHCFSLGQNRLRPCGMLLGVLARSVSGGSGRERLVIPATVSRYSIDR